MDPGAGLAILKTDTEKAPNDDNTWGALGDAYRDLGRAAEARAAYEQANAADPSDWRWYTRLKALQ